MEVTSLLELVLWKQKMQKEKEEVAQNSNDDDSTSFREDCRCQCGSDIVIGNVFGYLVEPGSPEEESPYHNARI